MRWFVGLFDRLFVVCGVLLMIQAPLFIQQYQLQLKGHVAELEFQVASMEQAAKHSHKTLDQFISKFIMSTDADFERQGRIMFAMVRRLQDLTESLKILENASILGRPWIFVTHLNLDIADSTWQSFKPGLTFSSEGFVYALVGMCFGYFLFLIIKESINGILRLFGLKKRFVNL